MSPGRLATDRRGAVLVEFAFAIMPVLLFFFGTIQLCALGYVDLLVKHAAFVAARAEAVVHPQMPDSGPPSDVEAAAKVLLAGTGGAVSVESTGVPALSQRMSTTTVVLDYPCTVPLGNVIACGSSRRHTLRGSASFPNQGAYYPKIWGHK